MNSVNTEATDAAAQKPKIKRPGVFLSVAERQNGEWVLLRGNKIISRHATEAEAMAAWDANSPKGGSIQ